MPRSRARLPRDYWRLFAASAVSNVGDGVLLAALPLLAARATDRPLSVGLVSAFFTLPWLLIGLPVGVLLDRFDRRVVMVSTDAFRAVLVGALALAAALTDVQVWMLWVLAVGLGAGEVFFDSGSQSMVAAIVGDHHLDRANGWRQSAEVIGNTFVGMPIGSLLFAAAVWLPFGIDAASFAVAALLVAGIRRRRSPPVGGRASIGNELLDGLRWLWGAQPLRDLAIALSLTNLAFAGIESTFVLFLTREIGLDERLFGPVVAAMGVGAAVAGLVSGRIVELFGRRSAIVTIAVTVVPVMGAIGLIESAPMIVVLATLQAMLVTVWSVLAVTIRQQTIPDHLFGRVNGAYRWLSWGAMPVGAATGALLASGFGLRAPYAVGTVLLAVAGGIVVARVVPSITDR